MNRNDLELLVPANNPEVFRIAVKYGADAIYIGGEMYGLRAKAKNFTKESMAESIAYAHEHGVKVFVTANIMARNGQLDGAAEYFRELAAMKPDGVIIGDPGMFLLAKENLGDIDIHISTQANNTNYQTFNFWYQLGAKRVVAARELSLDEIRTIRANIREDMEIEAFMHGAMCMSYSGRCLLSNYFTGRDANQGACTHPCRWKYHVVEETRPGEYMPVYEDETGTYIFNSKDLCMIEHIPEMVEAGINSFKIEGRMKTALYVATVARTYRKAIDDYLESEEKYRAGLEYYKQEIGKCTYREFTTGFFFGNPDNAQIYDSNTYITNYIYLGNVREMDAEGRCVVEQRNKFSVGDVVEVMKADGENRELTVRGIYDENGEAMESAPHPKQELHIDFGEALETYDVLRKRSGQVTAPEPSGCGGCDGM